MPTSRYQDKVLETYARSLLEAAKAENHVFEDLEMVERLASASPEIIAVLDTMSKRDQLDLLPKVAAAFKYVAEEDEDVVGVTVTTAIPLDDELRQTITKKCEQDFGRKVFLIEQVDPSIVGGLVLEARGERRDISVKTQLRIAQETLANSANSYGGEASRAPWQASFWSSRAPIPVRPSSALPRTLTVTRSAPFCSVPSTPSRKATSAAPLAALWISP